jgi:hypothetical protein
MSLNATSKTSSVETYFPNNSNSFVLKATLEDDVQSLWEQAIGKDPLWLKLAHMVESRLVKPINFENRESYREGLKTFCNKANSCFYKSFGKKENAVINNIINALMFTNRNAIATEIEDLKNALTLVDAKSPELHREFMETYTPTKVFLEGNEDDVVNDLKSVLTLIDNTSPSFTKF